MEAEQTNSGDLCVQVTRPEAPVEQLAEGAMLLRGFASAEAATIVQRIERMGQSTPLRHMVPPGGYRMSVAMLNCGPVGWVTDRHGYRYEPIDPASGFPWPAMPPLFRQCAERVAALAGFANFQPDCCLVNRYEPGAKLALHQDKDEATYDAPIVSVSLGLPATFLFGGLIRKTRPRRLVLESGDVVVWGGLHASRTTASTRSPTASIRSRAGAASLSPFARRWRRSLPAQSRRRIRPQETEFATSARRLYSRETLKATKGTPCRHSYNQRHAWKRSNTPQPRRRWA